MRFVEFVEFVEFVAFGEIATPRQVGARNDAMLGVTGD